MSEGREGVDFRHSLNLLAFVRWLQVVKETISLLICHWFLLLAACKLCSFLLKKASMDWQVSNMTLLYHFCLCNCDKNKKNKELKNTGPLVKLFLILMLQQETKGKTLNLHKQMWERWGFTYWHVLDLSQPGKILERHFPNLVPHS